MSDSSEHFPDDFPDHFHGDHTYHDISILSKVIDAVFIEQADVLRREALSEIQDYFNTVIRGYLDMGEGLAVYRGDQEESRVFSIMVSTGPHLVHSNNVAFVFNLTRDGEFHKSSDQYLEGIDFVATDSFSKINYSRTTLYRETKSSPWPHVDEVTRIGVTNSNKLFLHGNLRKPRKFMPKRLAPAARPEASRDVDTLIDISSMLRMCNETSFCPEINRFH